MVINFRSHHPMFRPDEEPGKVIIDVPVGDPVFYSSTSEGDQKLGTTGETQELIVVHEGEAVNRYSLAPGKWTVGRWLVSVFHNGGTKPWMVSVTQKWPVAVVTVPDYEPPEPPLGPLRVIK